MTTVSPGWDDEASVAASCCEASMELPASDALPALTAEQVSMHSRPAAKTARERRGRFIAETPSDLLQFSLNS
jgi:hypothetical protein